ncbi:hypothetical protein J6590_075108 [Homalodisca vitripennis]|nr:hypothetical protein J6590_075108 [Homalodisca vitripennis]
MVARGSVSSPQRFIGHPRTVVKGERAVHNDHCYNERHHNVVLQLRGMGGGEGGGKRASYMVELSTVTNSTITDQPTL